MRNEAEVFDILKKPLHPSDIEWRIGKKSKDKTKASILAYTTARGVMNRLDEAVGPGNWEVHFKPIDMGIAAKTDKMGNTIDLKGFACSLTIRFVDESGEERFIHREDVAPCTDFEAIKGGASGAMKRAAAQLGIGRYLYNLEATWVSIDAYGNFKTPRLPDWALPEGFKYEEEEHSQEVEEAPYTPEARHRQEEPQMPNDWQENTDHREPVIGFGKHKGKTFSEVPRDYIEWMSKNIQKEAVREQAIAWLASNPSASPAMDAVPW